MRPLLLSVALIGCATPDPHPVYAEIEGGLTAVTIPLARYNAPPPVASFRVENTGASNIYVTAAYADITGQGADLLVADVDAYTLVTPGQRVPVQVTLDPRTHLWDDGEFSVQFPIEFRYYFSGQAEDEPERVSSTSKPAPQAEVAYLTVAFSIDCDLDDDGVEAFECGGDDCNDLDRNVRPGVDEQCNAVDDDCDGAVDEYAIDRDLWYLDIDRDGFVDEATATLTCSRPGANWYPNNDMQGRWDCDDEDEFVNPNAIEVCNDGKNTDCDRFVSDCPVPGQAGDPECRPEPVCNP